MVLQQLVVKVINRVITSWQLRRMRWGHVSFQFCTTLALSNSHSSSFGLSKISLALIATKFQYSFSVHLVLIAAQIYLDFKIKINFVVKNIVSNL